MTGHGEPSDPDRAWAQGEGQPQPPGGFNQGAPLPPPPWGELPSGSTGAPGGSRPRRVEVLTAALLLSAVPWFFWSFAVVSWVVGLIGFGWGWLLVVVWFASGAVVFLRPTEDLLARY